MNAISLKGRSVLGLQDFTAGEIERILEVAAQMKKLYCLITKSGIS